VIGWLLAFSLAAPVVVDAPDPFTRCVQEAQTQGEDAGFQWGDPPDAPVDKLAIVVGVPCHRSPVVPSLAWSTRDALRVGSALQAGGYHVVALTTSVDAATLSAHLDEVERWLSPSGSLVVYFSGHGVLREERGRFQRYLVFTDTELGQLTQTAVSVSALERRLGDVAAAERVLIQDTCFAARPGQGGKSVNGLATGARAKGLAQPEPPPPLREGDQRLYASHFFEQALEAPELRGSVYTHHLLRALEAPELADLDGDSCVGTIEAHTFAATHTRIDRDGYQTPQLDSWSARNIPISCSATPTLAVVVASQRHRAEIPALDTSVTDGAVSVQPGRHLLSVDGPQDRPLYRGPIHLDAGEWLEVDAHLAAREPYGVLSAGAGWTDLGAGGATAVAGSFWQVDRDRGQGRWAAGLSVDGIPRQRSSQQCTQFTGGRASVRGAWLRSTRRGGLHAAAGPTVGAGAVWRAPYDACSEASTLPFDVAPMVRAGAQGQLAVGAVALLADVEIVSVPLQRADGLVVRPTPSVLLGIGIRR